MMTSQVLVLNRSYIPINIISLKRALVLVYQNIAKIVDREFEVFDFKSWTELSVIVRDESIGLVGRSIRLPRVILMQTYDRIPKRHVRFSRHNIYVRDGNTCQYCGKKFLRSDLNLDHVIPRSRGGRTSWDNVVTSCIPCNRRKGGDLLQHSGMKLIRTPVRPRWTPFMDMTKNIRHHEAWNDAWKPFFNIVDFTYWNLELKDE